MNSPARRPESVLVIVYTDDGLVLILKRRRPFPFWQSVTGSLDAGESPGDAAKRELQEETGLTKEGDLSDAGSSRTFTIDPRWRNRYADGDSENTEHEWRYRLAGVIDIRLETNEHDASRWVPIDDAIDLVWSWTNKEALQALKTELRGSEQSV